MTEEARKLADGFLPVQIIDAATDKHGGCVRLPGGRDLLLSKEDATALRSQPGTLVRDEGVASYMMRSHYEAVTAAKAKITGDGSAFIVNGKRFDHYDEAVKVACADIGLPPKSDDGLLATYHGATREKVARIIDPDAFESLKNGKVIPSDDHFQELKIAREKADAILALTPSHEAGTQTSRTIAVMQKLQESEDRDVNFLFTQLADCNSDSARREAVKSLRRQIIVVAAEMAQE